MKHRFAHQVLWTVFYAVVRPFARPVFHYRYKRERRIDGPAVIMGNHNLDIDVGLLGLSYRQAMRVVASEHVFRKGFITFLIKLFYAPIVRMKGKTEVRTVREMLRTVKAGGNVCVFPEGNRSYNGLTGEITKASASFVRLAKCQLITYRIEGGYFRHPRWARSVRKGPVSGREVGRYSPEQLSGMGTDEVLALICRDLYEDAYARQEQSPAKYPGKALAENIEAALYLCPDCGRIGTIQSRGDRFFCPCGLDMRFTDTGMLKSMGEGEARFTTVRDWDLWQQSMTEELVGRAGDGCIAQDDGISLYRITPCKKDELVETGTLSISKTALACGQTVFPLAEISDLAIIDLNTLVFETADGGYYEIRSDSAYSALKYRRFFLYCTTRPND
ncbi:MAG: 1-acyl-sn-glycerol-3-phosphate acyltransferase [Clostridiales bacterium]|nr:1-acyl-sn-glycerol-3-phosphate acyltransferase [Clostridiales bacterium]